MVLDSHEREAALVGDPNQLAVTVERIRVGDDGDPDLECSRLIRHGGSGEWNLAQIDRDDEGLRERLSEGIPREDPMPRGELDPTDLVVGVHVMSRTRTPADLDVVIVPRRMNSGGRFNRVRGS